MDTDRRLQERKQPEQMVFCKLGGDESCSVLNLSEDGLCFESLTPIEEKGLLQLRLSVDLNSAIEATGQLAWIDSAKRTGGMRFLELSAPAREQIHAWLEMRVSSVQFVPIERHRAETSRQFLRGVLVGVGMYAVVMILIFRYAGGTKPSSPARTTASANRAAQSSAKQTQVSAAQPVSSLSATPHPAGANQAAVASASTASKAHFFSGQVQHPKKVSATPEQLWSALQAGNIKAAVALADLYTRGEGVAVNCEQARILLLVASGKNNAEASKKLQELDKGGCPQTPSEPEP
jgi:PilZ domain-containing protein